MARKCPNCGGDAPMVSWVGGLDDAPECPACQGQTVVNTDYLGPGPGAFKDMNPDAEELFSTDRGDDYDSAAEALADMTGRPAEEFTADEHDHPGLDHLTVVPNGE